MTEFTKEMAGRLVEMSERHFVADEMLIKRWYGRGGDTFGGCSVGCFLYEFRPDLAERNHAGHAELESHTGIPAWIWHLRDALFEGLPDPVSRESHVRISKALRDARDARPVDWQVILHRTHIAILRVSYRHAGECEGVVQRVIDLHQRALDGEAVSKGEWSAARSAARSAAATGSASAESAAWAAWSAASVAADSARSAADSARAAADSARAAAWSAAYEEILQGFLEAIAASTEAKA